MLGTNVLCAHIINRYCHRKSEKPLKFNLLYRGTQDGFQGSAFHSKVDNKCPTVTVVETDQRRVFCDSHRACRHGSSLAPVYRRRDLCAQGLPGNLHLCQTEGISDYALYERNPDQRTHRRLSAGISAIRD